jgi:hypothetical protein
MYCGSFFRADSETDSTETLVSICSPPKRCARNAVEAHAQDFLAKELLLTIVKTFEQSTQYTLLEMLDVLSLCVEVELAVAPIFITWTSSRPPSKVNNSRTSSDTPTPLLGSFPDLSLVLYCLLSLESERASQSGNASDVFREGLGSSLERDHDFHEFFFVIFPNPSNQMPQ